MLEIFRASAGSGKTYSLSEQYLSLAFKNPGEKFRHILAVTFTNKAAGEMKERILKNLDEMIETGDMTSGFAATILHHNPQYDAGTLRTAALDLRSSLLHNYSWFQVSTIDSFVQRVIRAFAFEIGANSSYGIEMDTKRVIHDLLEMLYQEMKTDKRLFAWLLGYATFRLENSESWNFTRDLEALAGEIFSEQYQQLAAKAPRSPENQVEDLKKLRKSLYPVIRQFEQKMADWAVQGAQILEQQGMAGKQKMRAFERIRSFFEVKLPQLNFDTLDTLRQAAGDPSQWMKKSAGNEEKAKIEAVFQALNPLLQQVLDYYDAAAADYFTAKAVLGNLHAYGIFRDLETLLSQYRDENNILLISDASQLLRGILRRNQASFIYEKIGNRLQNIMIDEFQDTSNFQWQNFMPLLENTLAGGHYNMLVGDVKQSIYRWRNGDWRILQQGVKQQFPNAEIRNLQYNWRSHKQIIAFNNTLFSLLPHLIEEQLEAQMQASAGAGDLLKDYAGLIKDIYSDVWQKAPAAAQEGGRVEVKVFAGKGFKETVWGHLPQQVEWLMREKGYLPGDMGILVRGNREASELMDVLLRHQEEEGALRYPIISPVALKLSNSPAIRLLVAALQYLLAPDDSVALANVLFLHHRFAHPSDRPLEEVFFMKDKDTLELMDFLPDGLLKQLESKDHYSLHELVDELIRVFALHTKPDESAYLLSFSDIISDFTARQGNDLAGFLDYWAEKADTLTIDLPENNDALSILTIHKSKGLAFDVVLTPYTNWDMKPKSGQTLWVGYDQKPYSDMGYLPVSYNKNLAQSHFSPAFYEEQLFTTLDALNMLYVAFTRAREALVVYLPRKSRPSYTTVNDYMLAAFDRFNELAQELPTELNLARGKDWQQFLIDGLPPRTQTSETDKGLAMDLSGSFQPWQHKVSIHENASEFFTLVDETRKSRVDHGNLMHRLMAGIRTAADVPRVVERAVLNGELAGDEQEAIRAQLKAYVSFPGAAQWFSPKWRIVREKAILRPDGEQRIIDRALLGETENAVIDFKFGAPHPGYQAQVKEYMQLLYEIHPKPTKGFLYYPEKQEVVPVGEYSG